MPTSDALIPWSRLPRAVRADAAWLGRAGVADPDPAVRRSMLARHHALLRLTRVRQWSLPASALPATVVVIAGYSGDAEVRQLMPIALLPLVINVFCVLAIETLAARWARAVAPVRVHEAVERGERAPAAVRQIGPGSPLMAYTMVGLTLVFVLLGSWSVGRDRELWAAAMPGAAFAWSSVRGWLVVWALMLVVPLAVSAVWIYRLRPFDRGPAVRVDDAGIWVRLLRVTIPWDEVVGLHASGPFRGAGSGLAVQVRDPEVIVARSAYPRRLRRRLLWGLRGAESWIVVDERWLREPADDLLAAALAYAALEPGAVPADRGLGILG